MEEEKSVEGTPVGQAPIADKKATSASKKLTAVVIVMALVIIALIVAVVMMYLKKQEQAIQPVADSGIGGSNIVVTDDTHNLQQTINDKVAEGMISVKMTPKWNFYEGCTKSDAYLGNSERNSYPLTFTVKLADTDEVLLSSPEVPVGSCIENFPLDRALEPGEYNVNIEHHQMKDGEIYNTVVTESVIIVH